MVAKNITVSLPGASAGGVVLWVHFLGIWTVIGQWETKSTRFHVPSAISRRSSVGT